MGSTIIATQQRGYNKVSTAFPASYATGAGVSTASTTRPATQVVYDTASNNELISLIKFTPFMSANSGSTIGVRFLGWNAYTQADGTSLWIPNVLADFTLLFTSGTVPSASVDGTTFYLFSGITQNAATPTANLYSPRTNTSSFVEPCAALFDVAGSQIVTVQTKESAGTATGGIMWSPI
jgi:hypothetical protein